MAKYRIAKGHEGESICTEAPIYRNGNGRFNLTECTQKDLKYLFEVVKHPYVELVADEKATENKE